MRAEPCLVTRAPRGELVAPPAIFAIDQAHQLRRGVPVVVLAEDRLA